MAVSVDDLRPKPILVKLKGVELNSQPLRLSHVLIIQKLGKTLENKDSSKEEMKQAEADLDELVEELVPDLAGIPLDISTTLSLLQQWMNSIEPEDNAELRDKGVKFDVDPKAEKTT